jgi:putative DNA primase/helicase
MTTSEPRVDLEPEPQLEPSTLDLNLTDVGNAERLVARHGQDLRYCHPWSRWLVFDGRRWADDTTGEAVRRMKETLRYLAASANELEDDVERRALIKFALLSERDARVRAALGQSQSQAGIPVLPDELDADRWLLNVANGTVDLRTGELREHERGDLITKLVPARYLPGAECPLWQAALERWFAGDRELIEFVQRLVGYSLTGTTREQLLLVLYGPGENGKSTFVTTMLDLLGDYAQQTPTSTFLDRRGDAIPNDLARLRGARLVAAAETGESRRLNEALAKQMTGGDRISARFMRGEFFEFTPAFTPWLATNHKPEIRGTDHAIWRRIRLVPFTVTIGAKERDLELQEKLRDELEGILAWAIDGCLSWQQDGLDTPLAVEEATAEYRAEMDVVGRFLADCCYVGDSAEVSSSVLYARYGYWCQENGEQELSQNALARRLSDRGYQNRRSTGGKRVWSGLALSDDDPEPSVDLQVTE